MTKKNHRLLKIIKILAISSGLFGVILSGSKEVLAADSVNMGVNVVERKSTDTINDFNFSSLVSGVQPQVLGANTEKTYCLQETPNVKNANATNAGFWQKIINLFR